MKIQLKVVKADGNIEQYLHTKVMGTIGNALAYVDRPDIHIAEELAEVITYFLYHKQNRSATRQITSSEIFSIIKAVLAATNYEDAAIVLSEHHLARKLKRSRIEVIPVDIQGLADAEMFCKAEEPGNRSRWDKSRIVSDLVTQHNLRRQTARTIASMVEEKIFAMGITLVTASLIKQLVLSDTAAVLRAQHQLQTV